MTPEDKPEVMMLGKTAIRDAGGQLVDEAVWKTSKTLDLLRVLALSPGRFVSIDTLVELFWPHVEAPRGSTSLRTAVCHIRRVLGAQSVVRVGHGLSLQARVDVDAYRELSPLVSEARAEGRWGRVAMLVREAEALYKGDIDVTGTDCRALHEAHAELRALRMRMLLDGAEAAGKCADWEQSLALAQRASSMEVTDRSTRAAMSAWYGLGEAGRPVEEFERLRVRLATDYGVDPAPQTRALYLEIISSVQEWPPRGAVVGRDEQVRQVVAATMSRLMDPDRPGGVVWLVGHPGSGRQTVAHEARRVMRVPQQRQPMEHLADLGRLTPGMAQMLRMRARSNGRVLMVSVTDVADGATHHEDAIVGVPALDRDSFDDLMSMVLQGPPTPELRDELYADSRGLPGLASRAARTRIDAGDLVWTPRGVESSRRARVGAALRALAVSPFAVLAVWLGGEGPVETSEAHERERHLGPRTLVAQGV